MNNLRLISGLVAIANRQERSGNSRLAQLVTNLLERSYRYAVGFMDNIEQQDPFSHFAQWPSTNLPDPRAELRSELESFEKKDGEFDADYFKQMWPSRFGSYIRKVGKAVAADQSPEAPARARLFDKVKQVCTGYLESIESLDDSKNGIINARALIHRLNQPLGAVADTSVEEAPPVESVEPEVPETKGKRRRVKKPVPPVVTDTMDQSLNPEPPDEGDGDLFNTGDPTAVETSDPTAVETSDPTAVETSDPTAVETSDPTAVETSDPTAVETSDPTAVETSDPTAVETSDPTAVETSDPTAGRTPRRKPQPRAPKVPHVSDEQITDSVKSEVLRTFDDKIEGYEGRKSAIEDGFHRLVSVLAGPGDVTTKSNELKQQFEKLSQHSLNRNSAAFMAKNMSWENLDQEFKQLVDSGNASDIQAFLERVRSETMAACDQRVADARKSRKQLKKAQESGNNAPFVALINHPKQSKLRARVIARLTQDGVWKPEGANATDPNAVDPNAVDPNAVDPNAVDPNAIDPNAIDPNAIDPNAVDPNATDPNAVDTNAIDTNAVDPNAVDPNAVDPNATDPNATDPNAVDPNAVDPNATDTSQSDSFLTSLYQVFGMPGHVAEHIGAHVLGMSAEGVPGLHYIDALQADLAGGTPPNDHNGRPTTHTASYIRHQLVALRNRYTSALAAVRDMRKNRNQDQAVVNRAWSYLQSEVDPVLSHLESHGLDMPVTAQAAQLANVLPAIQDRILDQYPDGPMRDQARARLDAFNNAYSASQQPSPSLPAPNNGAPVPAPNGGSVVTPNNGAPIPVPVNGGGVPVTPANAGNPQHPGGGGAPGGGGGGGNPQHPGGGNPQPANSGFSNRRHNAPRKLNNQTRDYMQALMAGLVGFGIGDVAHIGVYGHGIMDPTPYTTTASMVHKRKVYSSLVPQIGLDEVANKMIDDGMPDDEIFSLIQAYAV